MWTRTGTSVAVVTTVLVVAQCGGAEWRPVPANAPFDYQIGGAYEPHDGVEVVARDWFLDGPLTDGYSICYVNAFQTQPETDGVERIDEASNWPPDLVLDELGDDPGWPGEYLVDLTTPESRRAAEEWVRPMIRTCADKGFDAVELDNLGAWTRFDGVPFGEAETVDLAAAVTATAHDLGLAVAQKNTLEIDAATADEIGFDFLIIEECGEQGECTEAARRYGDDLLAIEYTPEGFDAACGEIGDQSSVVLRDRDVSSSESGTYVYEEC